MNDKKELTNGKDCAELYLAAEIVIVSLTLLLHYARTGKEKEYAKHSKKHIDYLNRWTVLKHGKKHE